MHIVKATRTMGKGHGGKKKPHDERVIFTSLKIINEPTNASGYNAANKSL
jgi:hypothetical protein